MSLAWAKRLRTAGKTDVLSYEDLRGVYEYLRSTKRLLERAEKKNRYWKILMEIEEVFEKQNFGNTRKLKSILKNADKEKLGPDETYWNRKIELDLVHPKGKDTKEERVGKAYLKQGSRMTRAKNWQYRLKVAIEEAVENGWYPLFGTYTVAPQRLPKGCLTRDDLWKTNAWDRFVKRFKTSIAEACGQGRRPGNWDEGSTFFKYFAVMEHGKSGAHPHIHVIWLCKKLPASWKLCPNRNDPDQLLVDIPAASALWPWGVQRKTQALFITGSWFETNWKLPRKSKEEPGKIGSAAAVAGYIGKYLTKGETKKWNHRVKATQSLGIERLTYNLRKKTSIALLLTLACRPEKYEDSMKLQTKTECPLNLVREKSKKELYKRLYTLNTTRARKYLHREWTKKPEEFFMSFIQSVRDGLRPWRMMQQERYSIYSLMLAAVASTVHSKKRLKAAIDWLCYNEGVGKKAIPHTLLRGD